MAGRSGADVYRHVGQMRENRGATTNDIPHWKRVLRLERRLRGRLRCEWCNRMFLPPKWVEKEICSNRFGKPLPPYEVLQRKREGIFWCDREACLKDRWNRGVTGTALNVPWT